MVPTVVGLTGSFESSTALGPNEGAPLRWADELVKRPVFGLPASEPVVRDRPPTHGNFFAAISNWGSPLPR
jgi:hypothetical protein